MGSAGESGAGLGKALGWASFALGAPLVAIPGRVARAVGLDDTPGTRWTARSVGVRELVAGAGILAQGRKPMPGVWSRVAGDGMDVALLISGLRSARDRRKVGAALAAVGGIAALDILAAARLSRRTHPSRTSDGSAFTVRAGVTVNHPAEEAYALWRDFARLPEFMTHLRSVSADGTHWVAEAPVKDAVEWDATIVADEPGRLLSWKSAPGADVPNSGSVRFERAPGDRGTEVRVELTYEPPAGKLGNAVAGLLGQEPRQQVTDDLRRFKQILETGEVVRSEATPEGRRQSVVLAKRAGAPGGEGSKA
ncbi:MAG TPA: SRPBCC family protein [Mycobacteriales bacterium]|nr:SRPBCC family protein [Mycobacteriales bacterium]